MNTSYALSWLMERERRVLKVTEREDVDRGENRNASNRELNLRCERMLTASKRGERELMMDVMKKTADGANADDASGVAC